MGVDAGTAFIVDILFTSTPRLSESDQHLLRTYEKIGKVSLAISYYRGGLGGCLWVCLPD